MEPFGLDPETALKLIQMLLRGAGYFFAGFALLGLSTYVVFLCLEIFASQPRAKTRIARVPQPIGCAFVVEQTHDLVPVETPILSEEATVTGEATWATPTPADCMKSPVGSSTSIVASAPLVFPFASGRHRRSRYWSWQGRDIYRHRQD